MIAGTTVKLAVRVRVSSSRRACTTSSWKYLPRRALLSESETPSLLKLIKVLKSLNNNTTYAFPLPPPITFVHSLKWNMQRIMEYIDIGAKEGANIHLGGKRVGSEGYFIEPTIFTNTTPEMRIVQEEIFGPVGVVIKFKDEEDVLRQANDTGTLSCLLLPSKLNCANTNVEQYMD